MNASFLARQTTIIGTIICERVKPHVQLFRNRSRPLGIGQTRWQRVARGCNHFNELLYTRQHVSRSDQQIRGDGTRLPNLFQPIRVQWALTALQLHHHAPACANGVGQRFLGKASLLSVKGDVVVKHGRGMTHIGHFAKNTCRVQNSLA